MIEWKIFILLVAAFLICYFFPLYIIPFKGPVFDALALVRRYAREHVLLCLVPAFFIAGTISMFLSQASVIKYFGPNSNKVLSYGVASISGTILAVCSCTVFPLFSGIYKRGAGLGPAIAFLYSGPALSLPSMLVMRGIMGTKKNVVYVSMVVIMATISGIIYGALF